MPRYSSIWETLVQRAIAAGEVDIEAFVRMATEAGISSEELERRVADDLENNGPLFGKFIRTLVGAAQHTVLAASGQGEIVGHIATDHELKAMLDLADADDVIGHVIERADADGAGQLEELLGDAMAMTSVAELVNTCHICLPLHGKTLTLRQWREAGLHPSTRHPAGWSSPCKCRLLPSAQAASRKDIIAPLVREKLPGASRRTARSVTQASLERSREAVSKALESEEGRRTIRILGGIGAG